MASSPVSTPRITSVRSMVPRRFHRSTKTPANGPTSSTAAPTASRTPLTAAGAQALPLAKMVATHSTSVVSNA